VSARSAAAERWFRRVRDSRPATDLDDAAVARWIRAHHFELRLETIDDNAVTP
jgi:hypothetical protein